MVQIHVFLSHVEQEALAFRVRFNCLLQSILIIEDFDSPANLGNFLLLSPLRLALQVVQHLRNLVEVLHLIPKAVLQLETQEIQEQLMLVVFLLFIPQDGKTVDPKLEENLLPRHLQLVEEIGQYVAHRHSRHLLGIEFLLSVCLFEGNGYVLDGLVEVLQEFLLQERRGAGYSLKTETLLAEVSLLEPSEEILRDFLYYAIIHIEPHVVYCTGEDLQVAQSEEG